jgi:hypothetical protein
MIKFVQQIPWSNAPELLERRTFVKKGIDWPSATILAVLRFGKFIMVQALNLRCSRNTIVAGVPAK